MLKRFEVETWARVSSITNKKQLETNIDSLWKEVAKKDETGKHQLLT